MEFVAAFQETTQFQPTPCVGWQPAVAVAMVPVHSGWSGSGAKFVGQVRGLFKFGSSSPAPATEVPVAMQPVMVPGSGCCCNTASSFGSTACGSSCGSIRSTANSFGSTANSFGSTANSFGSTANSFGSTGNSFGSSTGNSFGSSTANSFGSSTANSFGSSTANSFREPIPAPGPEAKCEQWATMKDHLKALENEDPAKVLLVRDIKPLGFESAAHLEAHFAHFGQVATVYVSHSRTKASRATARQAWRFRAATAAFVVMSSVESVKLALEQGESHEVQGCTVRVQEFSPVRSDEAAGEQEEEKEGKIGSASTTTASESSGDLATVVEEPETETCTVLFTLEELRKCTAEELRAAMPEFYED